LAPQQPSITLAQARRLALHAQGLAAQPAAGTTVGEVVERIGCLQLDPVNTVARSPLLVLRARMRGGSHDSHARALDRVAYGPREGRVLFDYWCHEASLCHVGDLPLHRWAMRTYIERLGKPHRDRVEPWMRDNAAFADHVVSSLGERGPTRASELEDRSEVAWEWGHWTDEVSSRQTIARLLATLWRTGRVGIADRLGIERRWDVLERCLPPGMLAAADAEPLDQDAVVRAATLRAVSMLGVARATHINAHFTRKKYLGLGDAGKGVIGELERSGELVGVRVGDRRGTWFARPADLERLPRLEPGRRTLALSPFDNLICDRARAAELFGFEHRLEIYVPGPKRRWGYYVLPVLHGERIIARADLKVDREREDHRLRVLSLHPEPGRQAPRAIEKALDSLAAWLGAGR